MSAEQERSAARERLAAHGLRLLGADAAGSEAHDGALTLLDHAIAADSMRELDRAARTHVAGICAERETPSAPRGGRASLERLSDHCPIVLDVADRDDD